MSWQEMNCVLNPQCTGSSVYLSQEPPLEPDIPTGLTCQVFISELPAHHRKELTSFIRNEDQTSSGNVSLLTQDSLDRLLKGGAFVTILETEGQIIGSLISLPLRAICMDVEILTSYTFYLCIKRDWREKGLAMVLIRAMISSGYKHKQINHGYYMSSKIHHSINSPIQSWYRPLNLGKVKDAGFGLLEVGGQVHQRLFYRVTQPVTLPIKVCSNDYDRVIKILSTSQYHLNPTFEEFNCLRQCFDIYIVSQTGVFFLFPVSVIISNRKKTCKNAHLALMVGDVLPQAIWAANQQSYDLLYGWIFGEITVERVTTSRGLITAGKNYLEIYNSGVRPEISNFNLPLF